MNKKTNPQLKLGIPKGSLQNATLQKLAKAGYQTTLTHRSYQPYIDDPQITLRLIRAQEISRYVQHGYLDAGITGKDWIQENQSKTHEISQLNFNKNTRQPARWVLAVPQNSPIKKIQHLNGKHIATEIVRTTRQYLRKNNIKATVEFSWGATETKAHELVDAIVEITETGASLKANNLRILDTILQTTPRLIANHNAWKNPWKRQKIQTLNLLLQAAIDAETKVGIKLNIPQKKLPQILKTLPALRNPTISPLSQPQWTAVETIIDETQTRHLIPQLKKLGAEGIIEYPLNKIIH